MRDIGEPHSRGQVDRRAVEARALREALFGVAFFPRVALINGILALLFIALMQALGLWGSAAGRWRLARGDRRTASTLARPRVSGREPVA